MLIDEALVQKIARVCHEANAAWCRAHGDHTQPMWDTAPDWQRQSCLDGVLFHLQNPGAQPSASHDNWRQLKVLTGWRYGPKKDEVAKTHPCIVDFEQLDPVQQAKDRLFQSCVHALAPRPITEEAASAAADTESAHK